MVKDYMILSVLSLRANCSDKGSKAGFFFELEFQVLLFICCANVQNDEYCSCSVANKFVMICENLKIFLGRDLKVEDSLYERG